jgi:hypothetical protein
MNTRHLKRSLAILSLLVAPFALAQERGRTDGPEGSEYGKGGYSRASSGKFSLALDFGAAINSNGFGPLGGRVPLFVGATASFWYDDWFLLDISPMYDLGNSSFNVLLGPRFRAGFKPVSASLGIKAGPMIVPGAVFFGISPQVGFDMEIANHLVGGLHFATDIPIGGGAVVFRPYMSLGYRF